jgi:uncharacterized membrane protein YgdD (TMEM256/DUF423 family)
MPHKPMPDATRRQPGAWLAANGALCAATAVALSAYAAHAVQGPAQARLQTAAFFAFGHGLALAALAPQAARAPARLALALLYAGMLLFAGSLVLNVLAQWPTVAAPFGGTLMIAGWVLYAIAALRR